MCLSLSYLCNHFTASPLVTAGGRLSTSGIPPALARLPVCALSSRRGPAAGFSGPPLFPLADKAFFTVRGLPMMKVTAGADRPPPNQSPTKASVLLKDPEEVCPELCRLLPRSRPPGLRASPELQQRPEQPREASQASPARPAFCGSSGASSPRPGGLLMAGLWDRQRDYQTPWSSAASTWPLLANKGLSKEHVSLETWD